MLIVSHGVLAQEQFTDKDRVTGSSMINARFDFLMLGGQLGRPSGMFIDDNDFLYGADVSGNIYSSLKAGIFIAR